MCRGSDIYSCLHARFVFYLDNDASRMYNLVPLNTLRNLLIIIASTQFNNRKPRAKQQKGQKGKDDVYRGEIKYTAQRLYEKGVILEIEGLPPSQ